MTEPADREPPRVPCLRNPPHTEVSAHLQQAGLCGSTTKRPVTRTCGTLAELLRLHPLTLEDARTFAQRPKLEEYDGYLPMVVELQRIFGLKRDLVAMRRVVAPMRDLFARNADLIAELPGLQSDDRLYFRDLYDGLIRISELIDSYRDLLSGATDMYLSTVANRQGEVSKQLTIIATIFLPLTFLTGFFGQNFSFLVNHVITGLWAFLVLGIGGMMLAIVAFTVYFRRKRWI